VGKKSWVSEIRGGRQMGKGKEGREVREKR